MKTDIGDDYQAHVMGGDLAANDGFAGTATSTTATTLVQTGAGWTVNQWAGHLVHTASRYGVIASNTSDTLTIDKWYDPSDPGGAAGSTPSGTSPYHIGYGGFPGAWCGVTENATAPAAGDVSLAGELAGSGWDRRLCAWAHTAGANTYVLTTTFTSADGTTRTPAKAGFFNGSRILTGLRMLFETLIVPTATLVAADQVTLTETVTI
jgi:hypothetical protein